jgi:hypothetical protein
VELRDYGEMDCGCTAYAFGKPVTVPAPCPDDPVLDALDRLESNLWGYPAVREWIATVRSEVERLREERDELQQINRDWFGLQERERRLTEGLRDLVILVRIGFLLTVNGERPTADIVTDPKVRGLLLTILQAEDSEAAARALLSANPPQGDTAAFCEHGYTTEDSAHPSAGLERCPTCSLSDGGGAK